MIEKIKKILGKRNLLGYVTVEATIIIWIVLMIIFVLFYSLSWEFQKGAAMAKVDHAAIEESLEKAKESRATGYLTPESIGVLTTEEFELVSVKKKINFKRRVNFMMLMHRQIREVMEGESEDKNTQSND